MRINQLVQNQHTYQLDSKRVKNPIESRPAESKPTSEIKFSPEGLQLAERFQQDKRDVIYDQPDFNSNKALQAYSSVQNQVRRSEVQSLIGVDVYA
ncbi:hypothetical protein A7985_09285 [Pseudoalteromonas luteoviolacea]|uniref:Uncharacterized protein n=1 Tax=Pseudoalteromonas luteoviolacea TaxID=43657 RepID=A0A1C0TRW8_9GAMM|nr:hypothetical protein [Pseudoalteromonas luteoviolacea]MBQ4810628.1 hypothetical protein [Pseudoalteromonas luteoviolacea]OCQ21989.1 hypothetical protein A7985_09285 [Pseudoalteromonas luteoviolacea]